jgi:GTPase
MDQIKPQKSGSAVIALIGLPNSGKSSLLNRIIGERKAIVADEEHTTRDINTGVDYWDGFELKLVDTGGLVPDATDKVHKLVQVKSWSAIASADILVWVIDRRTNPEVFTLTMLQKIWKTGKPLIICINKVDNPNQEKLISDYARLGGKGFVNCSANSSYGINDLMDAIVSEAKALGFAETQMPIELAKEAPKGKNRFIKEVIKKGDYYIVRNVDKGGAPTTYEMVTKEGEMIPDDVMEDLDDTMKENYIPRVMMLGKPNVGKSSLINTLLKEEVQIVSDVAGTTLSVNDYLYTSKYGKQYVFVDSTGIRKTGSRESGAETFATFRTIEAAYNSDVILFILDASQPISHQDQVVGGVAKEAHKGLIILANKVDLLDADQKEDFKSDLFKRFAFLKPENLVFISATEKMNLQGIFSKIDDILERRSTLIPRNELRKVFNYLMKQKQPPKLPAKRKAVCYDLIQTKANPPTFEFLVKDKDTIHWSYLRFLENLIRKQFKLNETGVKVKLTEILNKNVED